MNDVENLDKRAKQAVRQHRSGLVTVAERLRRGLPRFSGLSDAEVLDAPFALHDAQQLIAGELGFASRADLLMAPDFPARPPRVHHSVAWRSYAQVFVRDVARSTAWYQDLLGCEVDYSYLTSHPRWPPSSLMINPTSCQSPSGSTAVLSGVGGGESVLSTRKDVNVRNGNREVALVIDDMISFDPFVARGIRIYRSPPSS